MTNNNPLIAECSNNSFTVECSSVQTHIKIMQDVIQRMAEASRQCKLQCIITVSLIIAAAIGEDRSGYILVSLVPAFMFLILDTYYLAKEKDFRCLYNSFVQKLARGDLIPSDLYVVKPPDSAPQTCFQWLRSLPETFSQWWKSLYKSLKSGSIWIFYPPLVGTILLVWCLN